MNQVYFFNATVYKADNKAAQETASVVASGSQETRARRRVLDGLHSSGLLVRKLELVAFRPATKGDV